MLVYLVRHAIAEERDPLGRLDDAARRLTKQGIERMRRNVSALSEIGVTLDAIWTSPLVRAVQTADLLKPLLNRGGQTDIVNELAGGGRHAIIVDRLSREKDLDAIAIVGHEPDMGELASILLFADASDAIRFKKGGVACIDLDENGDSMTGVLRWMLTPRQMRAMA